MEAVASDLVLEIRHFLLSCPETCEYTCYHLQHGGVVLNDYAEIGSCDSITRALAAGGGSGAAAAGGLEQLRIVPDLYDERGVRLHVKRVREMLRSPPFHIQTSLVLTLDELQEKEKKKKEGRRKNREQQPAAATTEDDSSAPSTAALTDDGAVTQSASTLVACSHSHCRLLVLHSSVRLLLRFLTD